MSETHQQRSQIGQGRVAVQLAQELLKHSALTLISGYVIGLVVSWVLYKSGADGFAGGWIGLLSVLTLLRITSAPATRRSKAWRNGC